MTVGSGRQLSMLLEQSSPLGAFSRILLESSAWTNSKQYCYVWQLWATKQNDSGFRLTQLGPTISDTEPLLWQTPRNEGFDAGKHNGKADSLHSQAKEPKLWPTPTGGNHHENQTLEDWEASNARLRQRRKDLGNRPDMSGHGYGLTLGLAAKLWPTPTTRDYKDGTAESCANVLVNGLLGRAVHDGSPGSLNPRFVEELMGFRIDHTALKRSATPSFRSSPTRSLRRSRKSKGGYEVPAQTAALSGQAPAPDAPARV
jgi:hypothetical protein